VARRAGESGRLHTPAKTVRDRDRDRERAAIGELWVVQLGWDIRLFVDGDFRRSNVYCTEDEVFDTIGEWRDALKARAGR